MADKSKYAEMPWFKRAIDKSISTTESIALLNQDICRAPAGALQISSFSKNLSNIVDLKRKENKSISYD